MDKVIGKVNRILEGLMNCRIEFQQASDIAQGEWNSRDLNLVKSQNTDAPRFVEGESTGVFGFPVRRQGLFMGLAIVRGWQGARSNRLIQLSELLTTVLETSLNRDDQSDSLRIIEERMRLSHDDSNVVLLRPSKPSRQPSIDDIPETYAPIESPIVNTPLLIEVKSGFPLQRIAVEIHQMAGRWAFLTFESLSSDILDSRESLKELGKVTIYIENLTKLSSTQQLRLAEYLSTKPGKDMPQFISGLNQSRHTLIENGSLLPRLVDAFCVSEITWSEKTGSQVTSELIDMSLRFILEKTRASELINNSVQLSEESSQGVNADSNNGTTEPRKSTATFLPFNVREIDTENPTLH